MKCCHTPQSDVLVIQDCARPSLGLVVGIYYVPCVILDVRSPEGYDRM